ncbi:MAG: hypothetical protein M0Q88_08055 [Bacilli bacterium]|nr:hypothetical protein [Bacilli bacterium]
MEIRKLFRKNGDYELYFGMRLVDNILYSGCAIGDEELETDYSLYNLCNYWNSLTDEDLESIDIDSSFFDSIVIEFLKSKNFINLVESHSDKELAILCLDNLKRRGKLNKVGEVLLQYKDLFSRSLISIGQAITREERAYWYIANSQLVSNDIEGTILYWVFLDERDKMRDIIKGIKNEYLVVIDSSFVRDAQVVDNEYIINYFNGDDICSTDYYWFDVENCDLSVGIYQGHNVDEVLRNASMVRNIDKRALKAYQLK